MQHTDIDWCINPDGTSGYSWNPCWGCSHQCDYCYGQGIANRFHKGDFSPRFYPERVNEPYRLKKPAMIFLGSMTDMFGAWVEALWWNKILRVIWDNPKHIFSTLTKNPVRIGSYLLPTNIPPNLWLGTTVESAEKVNRIPWISNPAIPIKGVRFISFEPLQGNIEPDIEGIDWVIIGAETGNRRGKIVPKREWVDTIVEAAHKKDIPVWMKNNLMPVFEKRELLRQMPSHWKWKTGADH